MHSPASLNRQDTCVCLYDHMLYLEYSAFSVAPPSLHMGEPRFDLIFLAL